MDTREMKEIEAAVEGILFASGEPVGIDRVCVALDLDKPTAELVLQRLQDYYSYERRGIRLLKMDDSYQLCSAPEYGDQIRRAFEIRKPAKLSQPALEVLTIIAYYQPTTRAYVDQIRGVDSSYTVGLLLDRHLIEECGRLQVPGRPRLYRTTQAFLRAFHLDSLEDLPQLPGMEADGQMRLQMMGGEFCGNASRAYGYLLAKQQGLTGRHTMHLSVSGCDHPVAVTVDMDAGTASAEMPLPKLVEQVEVAGTAGTLVHLGGIAHLVVQGVAPSRDFFAAAEPIFAEDPMLEAYGVCFIEGERMTPLVKVPEAGTLVFEGSCGSGTLASAIALSEGHEGTFSTALTQPAGTVYASVTRQAGVVTAASIGGSVALEAPITVAI